MDGHALDGDAAAPAEADHLGVAHADRHLHLMRQPLDLHARNLGASTSTASVMRWRRSRGSHSAGASGPQLGAGLRQGAVGGPERGCDEGIDVLPGGVAGRRGVRFAVAGGLDGTRRCRLQAARQQVADGRARDAFGRRAGLAVDGGPGVLVRLDVDQQRAVLRQLDAHPAEALLAHQQPAIRAVAAVLVAPGRLALRAEAEDGRATGWC